MTHFPKPKLPSAKAGSTKNTKKKVNTEGLWTKCPVSGEIVFNKDWLGKMTFEDVIRLCSRYTVARILERDDFTKRLAEQRPIAMHEILYPLCQGMDSVEIVADVEIGGNDQKFNNLVGRTLMEQYGQEPQCVVLCPLLVGLDGSMFTGSPSSGRPGLALSRPTRRAGVAVQRMASRAPRCRP